MAAEEENNKKKEGKGFAGLSSLVSDVDTTPPPPPPNAESAGSTTSTGRTASQATQPQPQQPTQRQAYQKPSQPSSGSSGGKWILGIATVVGLLWLIGQSDKRTRSPSPAYSPPAQSTAPSYSLPTQPQTPTAPQESKPPVGQNSVLSETQIRYCLAEDIRMDAAKAVLNNYSDSDVNRFNAMVADYNSRCGSFRYRGGALERVRRDVEPYRSQLQAEGRSRFAGGPSTGSLSAPAPVRPVAHEAVRALQQRLNELGYSAGPADGLMGRDTRAAILAFQQDRGLAATGVADQELLLELERLPANPTGSSTARQPQRHLPVGKPSLAQATSWEQAAIENACNYARQHRAVGDYYYCIERELQKLASSQGKPDLSRITQSERASIDNFCNYDFQYRGPGDYYSCLRRELSKLR